jgi:hypothetical protein
MRRLTRQTLIGMLATLLALARQALIGMTSLKIDDDVTVPYALNRGEDKRLAGYLDIRRQRRPDRARRRIRRRQRLARDGR